MKVETYEAISVDEQKGTVINEVVSEEALALIESLGLEGQKSLVETREVGGEEVQTRFPYRKMTREEQAVFGAVMPHRTRLHSYSDGPIPLRALQVAAHAQSLNFFDHVEVWHPEPGRDDPVLVGCKKNAGGWGLDLYLLARWGDELVSMDDLRQKAKAVIVARAKSAIAKARAQLTGLEGGLEEKVESFLLGGDDESIYVNVGLSR